MRKGHNELASAEKFVVGRAEGLQSILSYKEVKCEQGVKSLTCKT